MKKSTARVTVGLVAVGMAATGVAVAQTGSAAPAPATMHTMRLVAHQSATHNVRPNGFLGSDVDRSRRTHRIVGYDSITGHFNLKTHVVRIDVAAALKDGIITLHLKGMGQSNRLAGVITGGTGAYRGIQGTVHTHGPGKTTYVRLDYTL